MTDVLGLDGSLRVREIAVGEVANVWVRTDMTNNFSNRMLGDGAAHGGIVA